MGRLTRRGVLVAVWLLAAASIATSLTTTAGGADSSATGTQLGSPTAAVPTADGGFLVTDFTKCQVSKVLNGQITPVAGDGDCLTGPVGPVSCPSTSFCAAGYGTDGIAFTTNPGDATPSWTITKHIRDANSEIEGLSCASASLCVISQKDGKVYTSTNVAGGASTWHSQQVTSARSGDVQEAITCPTTTLCITLGDSADQILVSTNPGDATPTWTPTTIAGGNFWGVNCRSASLCAVYGSKTTAPSGGGAAVATDPVNGPWQLGGSATVSSFQRVTCVSTTLCVAAGNGDHITTSTNPTDASPTWTTVASPTGNGLYGLSCATATMCVATGLFGDLTFSTNPTGGAAAWTLANTRNEAQSQNRSSSLCADSAATCTMACPSATLCMGSGDLGTLFSSDPTGGASKWSQREPGNGGPATAVSLESPGDAVPIAGGGFLVQEGSFPSFSQDRNDVREVTAGGTMTRVIGTGAKGNTGDGGQAVHATISSSAVVPFGAPGGAVTTPGNAILLTDAAHCVVRKVEGGVITRVAGTAGSARTTARTAVTAATRRRRSSTTPSRRCRRRTAAS